MIPLTLLGQICWTCPLGSALVRPPSEARTGVCPVGGGASCWYGSIAPSSLVKKRAASTSAISVGSNVSWPSARLSAWMFPMRLPCLHAATSQTSPFSILLSAHFRFAAWVTCLRCLDALCCSSTSPSGPESSRSAVTRPPEGDPKHFIITNHCNYKARVVSERPGHGRPDWDGKTPSHRLKAFVECKIQGISAQEPLRHPVTTRGGAPTTTTHPLSLWLLGVRHLCLSVQQACGEGE
jgi:hypothetical protein